MRQVQIDRFGGPEELRLVDGAPSPVPAPGLAHVRVLAAGVNPVDKKMRDGSHKSVQGFDQFPLMLGREACGELLADCGELSAGTRVFGMIGWDRLGGCYAEETLLPADGIVAAPQGVADEVLGGAALAWYTALNAVEDVAQVRSDDVVLIHGAGGGVGQLMVQLCVAAGAQVWASASTRHHDRLTELGAHHVDYTREDVFTVTPHPSVVLDGVWFDVFEPSLDHLRPGGRVVVLPSLADLSEAERRGIPATVPTALPGSDRLQRLADGLADGSLSVKVSRTYALADAAEAHRAMDAGHADGKLVLLP